MLLGALLVGLLAGVIYSLWQCIALRLDRDGMERLVIRWACRDEDFAEAGDVFLTTDQFRNLRLQ